MLHRRTAEMETPQRFFRNGLWGGPALRCSIWGAQEMCMNHRVLLVMGIPSDAVSSVWASLRRKMVRGEGFEPPTNSV